MLFLFQQMSQRIRQAIVEGGNHQRLKRIQRKCNPVFLSKKNFRTFFSYGKQSLEASRFYGWLFSFYPANIIEFLISYIFFALKKGCQPYNNQYAITVVPVFACNFMAGKPAKFQVNKTIL